MARRKGHRWGKDAGADLVQIGRMTAKGLGRIGTFVKEQSVKRRLSLKI